MGAGESGDRMTQGIGSTSLAKSRENLTRHLDWDHGVRPLGMVTRSMSELMEWHAARHDNAGTVEHRLHLAKVLKGKADA